MKMILLFKKSGLAFLAFLLFIAGSSAQDAHIPFLIDIPQGEDACHLLSGDNDGQYLTLAAEPAAGGEGKRQLARSNPAPEGLYLGKDGKSESSKWAFKAVEEEDVNGEYYLECMDGAGRLVAWGDGQGFFFRPLSVMDGKMQEMATWMVKLGGVNDIGETYYIIYPKKEKDKVLAVDRKTGKVDVFPEKVMAAARGKNDKENKTAMDRDAPDLEVLWKRVCKK